MAKQQQLFDEPEVVTPTVRIPQPDGSLLFRAGKPVVVEKEIGTAEAARILGLSPRRVEFLCEQGDFTTAHKPGGRPKSRWRIARSEVLERKQRSAE